MFEKHWRFQLLSLLFIGKGYQTLSSSLEQTPRRPQQSQPPQRDRGHTGEELGSAPRGGHEFFFLTSKPPCTCCSHRNSPRSDKPTGTAPVFHSPVPVLRCGRRWVRTHPGLCCRHPLRHRRTGEETPSPAGSHLRWLSLPWCDGTRTERHGRAGPHLSAQNRRGSRGTGRIGRPNRAAAPANRGKTSSCPNLFQI